MSENNKIIIELSPSEAEILIGAIANHVPADKSHEWVLSLLYHRIKTQYENFFKQ